MYNNILLYITHAKRKSERRRVVIFLFFHSSPPSSSPSNLANLIISSSPCTYLCYSTYHIMYLYTTTTTATTAETTYVYFQTRHVIILGRTTGFTRTEFLRRSSLKLQLVSSSVAVVVQSVQTAIIDAFVTCVCVCLRA